MPRMRFRIEFSWEAIEHLRALTATERRRALDAAESQLSWEPLDETRNRRPMRPNPLAPWELRVGSLRLCCEVQEGADRVVLIRAVGLKRRNEIWIGGERIAL